jgi:prepilin-type processing-associated H-X9-DG protein
VFLSLLHVTIEGLKSQERIMPVARRCKCAFTLVELLIILAIIALLIALLFPSLGAARRQAKTVVCASNLRQLDLAFRMYVEANDARFNPVAGHWALALRPYLGKTPPGDASTWVLTDKVLLCPEASEKSTSSSAGGAFEPWTTGKITCSYGMLGEQKTALATLKIRALKRVPIFFDSTQESVTPSSSSTYFSGGMNCIATRRHLRVANVAFVDGSVQTIQLPELWKLDWTNNWMAPNPLPRVPW